MRNTLINKILQHFLL